jgi:hypothetical protein
MKEREDYATTGCPIKRRPSIPPLIEVVDEEEGGSSTAV